MKKWGIVSLALLGLVFAVQSVALKALDVPIRIVVPPRSAPIYIEIGQCDVVVVPVTVKEKGKWNL